MTFSRSALIAGLAAVGLAAPASVHAAEDDLCVPQASGVPGPQNKFPEWWVPGAPGKEQRWTGASVRIGNPQFSATPELASLRTIWDAPSRRLFVHLSVKGDPQINPSLDMAAFALTDPSGNRTLYFDMSPMLGCATADTTDIGDVDAGCQNDGEALSGSISPVRYAGPSGGGWGPLGAVNPTVGSSFEITVENPWVQVAATSSSFDWDLKFALVLPVGGSGQVDPGVRIYGTSFVSWKDGTSVIAPVVTFQYPLLCNASSVGTCEIDHGAAGATLPDAVPTSISEWPEIQTGGTGDCGGIELMRALVGSETGAVMGVVPGTSAAYELPGRTLNALSGSSLWAGFHNDTSAGLTTGQLTAEFRIANWGLTYADWDDATWTVATTAALAGSVDAGNYGGAPGQGSIKSAPYTAGSVPTNPHQCMHVKLSTTPGTGSTAKFKVDSVYRNMDFVNASVVQRPADVNLVGRALGPGQTENPVVLLVRTANLPTPEQCKRYQGDLAGCQPTALNKDPGSWDRMPRYTVHGFVDSGRKVNLPGAPQTSILSPFSSYGFYVNHEGSLEGWEHRLDGAQPIDPYRDLYYLPVPDGQIATVVNTIRAIDDGTRPCGPAADPTAEPDPAQLGCETEKPRPPCKPGTCAKHDVCSLIEGSKFTHLDNAEEGPPEISTGPSCIECNPKKPGPTSCLFILLLWGIKRRRR